jgi:hypothetical protein
MTSLERIWWFPPLDVLFRYYIAVAVLKFREIRLMRQRVSVTLSHRRWPSSTIAIGEAIVLFSLLFSLKARGWPRRYDVVIILGR